MRAHSVARLRRGLCAAQPQREGCGTRGCAPQTVLALFPVAPCAARRRKGLIENHTHINRLWHQVPLGVLFLPPRAAPSNGVGPGVVGEDCLRAKPEFRSRPARRVAQGSRQSRPRNAGVAFFLVTFSWRRKKKLPARQARNPAVQAKINVSVSKAARDSVVAD